MRFPRLLPLLLLLTGCSRTQSGGAPLVDAYPTLRFTQPVDLQAAPDGTQRMFVVEQGGRIKVFPTNAATPAATTFLDLSGIVVSGGELGLLGLAFHPQYAQNGQFFVFYTRRGTSGSPYEEVVARYRVSAANQNAGDPASAEVLLTVKDPYSNHNGGQLQFGPDGMLYVALGDGGSGGDPQGNGQNTNTLLGKLLRLDVDARTGSLAPECDGGGGGRYHVPADNPFAGPTVGCGEVYAYGLRNPWRFSFGPNGTLWAADVGQGAWEEVDKVTKGGNYGWNTMEGAHCFGAATCDTGGKLLPVHAYGHNMDGGFSITGGYVQPAGGGCAALTGRYIFGDYVSKHLWALRERPGAAPEVVRLVNGASQGVSVSTFGLEPGGRMLVADHSGGRLMTFNCAALPVGVETGARAPAPLSLTHAGPSPFTSATTLRLRVQGPARVVVAAYDVLGPEVARVFGGEASGEQALRLDGAAWPPGPYVVRAMSGGAQAVLKVVRGR